MIAKYTVEFSPLFKRQVASHHFSTDDPVACEEFLEELLDRGFSIQSIKHEGVELPRVDFDRMVKTAAGMLISKRLCSSLHIKPDEEKFRFGFAV